MPGRFLVPVTVSRPTWRLVPSWNVAAPGSAPGKYVVSARSLAKPYALDQLHAEPVDYEHVWRLLPRRSLKSTIQTIFIGLTDSALFGKTGVGADLWGGGLGG